MHKFIISVLGEDQPGIIAAITQTLFEQDFNIEDVSQTILQNQFSGIFISSGPQHISPQELQDALQKHTQRFKLHFHVRNLKSRAMAWTTCDCEPFVITTRGPDQKGLVSRITALLAAYNVNVTQLQAVFRGANMPGKNIMIYEVDIPMNIDHAALRQALKNKGEELRLEINIQHKNIFEAINRI